MREVASTTGINVDTGSSFLNLPSELLLYILSFLSARDILAFRQTCKQGDAISQDHALWLELLRCQREYLPLPPVTQNDAGLVSLDSACLEALVVSAQKSSDNWPRSRKRALHLGGTPDEHNSILYLDVLLDQFVLCVHSNGSVLIWRADMNINDESPASSWDIWANEPFTSAMACTDETAQFVYVALTRTQTPTEIGSTTSLMKLPLPYASGSATNPEEEDITLCGADSQIVRAIDVRRHLIAFSRISFIDVVHWPSKTGMSIDTHTDDLEELWNGIIGLSFVGDRLLCIRARSLELYAVVIPFPEHARYFVPSALEIDGPTSAPTAALIRPIAVHKFVRTNFRTISLSTSASREATVFLLGNDVLRGVYLYRVDILGNVAEPHEPRILLELRVSLLSMYTRLDGSVIAVALGLQGRRGAFVERMRSSTARRVLAFNCLPTGPPSAASTTKLFVTNGLSAELEDEGHVDSEEQDSGATFGARGIHLLDAIDVYNVHSLDLRQDIVHVAFSEVTGRIALGTRSGDVRLI